MFQNTANAYNDIYTTDTTGKILEKVDANKKKKPDYNVIVFPRVAKRHICFRECAKLIRIAEETGSVIHLSEGTKRGSTESLISLLRMKIRAGTSVTVTIQGKDTYTAFHQCADVLEGKDLEENTSEKEEHSQA